MPQLPPFKPSQTGKMYIPFIDNRIEFPIITKELIQNCIEADNQERQFFKDNPDSPKKPYYNGKFGRPFIVLKDNMQNPYDPTDTRSYYLLSECRSDDAHNKHDPRRIPLQDWGRNAAKLDHPSYTISQLDELKFVAKDCIEYMEPLGELSKADRKQLTHAIQLELEQLEQQKQTITVATPSDADLLKQADDALKTIRTSATSNYQYNR